MADNYLEKRYEETLGSARPKVKRIGNTVDGLVLKNRSYRGYKKAYKVSRAELERIVSVCTKIPSARNQQVLRYYLVTHDSGAEEVLGLVKMGAALPELHLPLVDTEPEAFIICCSVAPETKLVDIDLGIALQTMLLKAVEMGLNGLIIGAFNKERLCEVFDLQYTPLAILAIGKGAEKIELVRCSADAPRNYWREGSTHYVPKLGLDDILLNNA